MKGDTAWKPIASAPQEGYFVVAIPKGYKWKVAIARRRQDGSICGEAGTDYTVRALWWAALPSR